MRRLALCLLLGCAAAGCALLKSDERNPDTYTFRNELVWSDEFDGDRIDRDAWVFETGDWGWGNAEWQRYADSADNAFVEDGALVIQALHDGGELDHGHFTSARMITKGRFELEYGRVEARIRLPQGQGIWPAFWMLGGDIDAVGWPACGEIDIMEFVGDETGIVHGTLHGPWYSGLFSVGEQYELATGAFPDDYHVFAVVWEPNQIRWYVDGEPYHTVGPGDLYAWQHWVFDHDFYILLNLAVGGRMPGYPDETTTFPQRLYVDWVRVYR